MDRIRPLSEEEIQTLQVDAVLRLLGEIDRALTGLNFEIAEALNNYLTAKIELEKLKAEKEILIERARVLKTICQNA